ncbi:MAG TPA: glycerophosphodiester phosphodiesterase [Candidatus Saccharimonadales bacterium]|nr:glycerophosphodiester phosphodiesterase [Candidatus Saccharimonadales bacterium]
MDRRPLRLAHRGDWRRAPENTLAAMLAAVAIPACDGLELDVRLSADGIPILLHDPTLARIYHRPERPDQLSATELERLGVSTLASVLAAIPPAMFLDVEMKGDTGGAVVEVLTAHRGVELRDAVVSSFDDAALERVAGLAPTWPRWLNARDLTPATIERAVSLGCVAIAAEWRAIDEASAARVSHAGLGLAAWTVRRRSTFDGLARLGVMAACVEAAALDGP